MSKSADYHLCRQEEALREMQAIQDSYVKHNPEPVLTDEQRLNADKGYQKWLDESADKDNQLF